MTNELLSVFSVPMSFGDENKEKYIYSDVIASTYLYTECTCAHEL